MTTRPFLVERRSRRMAEQSRRGVEEAGDPA
jgi:hypothetical protein